MPMIADSSTANHRRHDDALRVVVSLRRVRPMASTPSNIGAEP
jgi:hypothetical protein